MEALKGKVALISLAQNPCEIGLRYISSVLKENRYTVMKLFLRQRFEVDISSKIAEQIIEFSKESLFIGISIMTDNVILSRNIAKKLKQINGDVILVGGGIHPTVRPDDIIDVFDIAVRGEAEQTIVMLADEIANGKRVQDIRLPTVNTNYYKSEEIGFVKDIDNLPYPDFSDNFILKGGKICFEENYMSLFGDYYSILSSRGCPYSCAYCVNSFYLKTNKPFFRKRKVDKMIAELGFAKERYGIKNISFPSDNFLSFSESEIYDFASRFEKEIKLPFICVATPNNIKEGHIRKLVDVGLIRIAVGIESGSENTLNLYERRHGSPQNIVEAARVLDKFHPRLSHSYFIILDNPYETREDLMKTVSLLHAIPQTYDDLGLFSLTFYPGTHLYNKAVQDGLIEEAYYLKKTKYYHQLNKSFYNIIFLLFSLKANPSLIASFIRLESAKGMMARVLRTMAASLTNVLLGLTMVRMLMFSMRHKNKTFIFHYIKLGFAVIKSSLLRRKYKEK